MAAYGATASGSYSHGVLVGNWSEDRSGLELLQKDATDTTDKSLHFTSVLKESPRFTAQQIASARDEQATAATSNTSSTALFGHAGAPSEDVRMLSASKLAYIHPKDQVPPRTRCVWLVFTHTTVTLSCSGTIADRKKATMDIDLLISWAKQMC